MQLTLFTKLFQKVFQLSLICRNSQRRCSLKKCVPRNFAKFTGKHLCHSFSFNKVASLRPITLLKKRLWHRCFPVNFSNFPRTPFLQNTSGRLLPNSLKHPFKSLFMLSTLAQFPYKTRLKQMQLHSVSSYVIMLRFYRFKRDLFSVNITAKIQQS